MRCVALVVALASAAPAAIQGRLVNGTSGQPLAGAPVTLVRMSSGGREPIATLTTDSQGRFDFETTPDAVHYLLEAQFDGVTYTRMVDPRQPTQTIELIVYSATRRASSARLTQRMVFLEPEADRLRVTETWLFRNDGRLTWLDPTETFRFYLPAEAGSKPSLMVTGPGSVPVPRSAEAVPGTRFFRVSYPIKPGETRFDIIYALPTPKAFATRMPYPGVPTRLIVPAGVKLSGEDLESLGPDPSGRATIFEIKGRREFALQVQGAGSLGASEAERGPQLNEILPPIYDHLAWILAPAIGALLFGFILLFRTSPRTGGQSRP